MSTYKDSLAAFLNKDENTESALAGEIGRTQAAVNRYRNGERFPDAETARLIDEKTKGEVPFDVWRAEFMARSGLDAAA